MKTDLVDVLVVGAGPTGLMTALGLAREGVRVRIVDRAHRPASHSYACLLHPRSLRILERVGLGSAALQAGRRVDTVTFYDDNVRSAQLDLTSLPGPYGFAVVLPQSELEDLLEERLRAAHGIQVEWNHRLSDLEP